MYICNSSVALKVAHITDLCNHACRILDDRQRLKTCQYYGFLQPTGLELGFGEIHTLTCINLFMYRKLVLNILDQNPS